jgi:hypothetical protein
VNACATKLIEKGLASLTPHARVVALVNWLEFEVLLGGIETFYTNSAGNYAPETVAALEAIRAPRSARALAEANALVQDKDATWPPRDTRWDRVRAIPRDRWTSLSEIMEDEGAVNGPLLAHYVRLHASALMRTD